MSIAENYKTVLEKIKNKALSCGRSPDEVTLLPISKTFSPADMEEGMRAGMTLFGENRVQEAKQKAGILRGDFKLHLVGHLQSNKSKDAVKIFDVIHSLDKISTAMEVNKAAEKAGKIQKVMIEVNTSGEISKNGTSPDGTLLLAEKIMDMKYLTLIGLMTIGPLTDEKGKIRVAFRLLRETRDIMNKKLGTNLNELSMGMSSDYEIAIEEGSTIVRIGTAIFGNR